MLQCKCMLITILTDLQVIVNVQFEKGIRDIFVGVFVSS